MIYRFSLGLIVFFSVVTIALGGDPGISGIVLSPEGKPVKDAEVFFSAFGNMKSDPDWELPVVRTDEAGQFRFDAQVSKDGGSIVARAAGFGVGFESAGKDGRVKIKLAAPSDLTVSFVTPEGKPASGIAVRVATMADRQVNEFSMFGRMIEIRNAKNHPLAVKTNAEGICTIAGLPQGVQVLLAADDERFAALNYQDGMFITSRKPATIGKPVHLQIGSSISGKLTIVSTGKPATGVRVGAQSQDGWAQAFTGDDGQYTIKQMLPGKYNIALDLAGTELEKSLTAKAHTGVEVEAGEKKSGVDFELIGGSEVVTQVTDQNDKPLPGVNVGIFGPAHPRSGGWVQTGTTDADGKVVMHVPGGEQFVYAMNGGGSNGGQQVSSTVTVEDGKNATLTLKVNTTAPRTIKGKVVGPDGAPLAGASVWIGSEQIWHPTIVQSDDSGSFEAKLSDNGKLWVRALKDDLATPKTTVLLSGSKDNVLLKLQKDALASVQGQLVDGDGKPLPEAAVEITDMTTGMGMGRSAGVTDDDGKYTINSLWPDGKYSVTITKADYGQVSSKAIKLSAGQTTSAPDLTLKKLDSAIAGTVQDEDGKPLKGIQIYINGPKSGSNNVTTDKEGKFRQAVVSGDVLNLYILIDRTKPLQKKVNAGDEHILISPVMEGGL